MLSAQNWSDGFQHPDTRVCSSQLSVLKGEGEGATAGDAPSYVVQATPQLVTQQQLDSGMPQEVGGCKEGGIVGCREEGGVQQNCCFDLLVQQGERGIFVLLAFSCFSPSWNKPSMWRMNIW